MGKARVQATYSRQVILEPESWDRKQTQEQEEEEVYKYRLPKEANLEAARLEAEKQKHMFHHSQTAPPPPLKESLDKVKQPQFQC